jgi:hypothetical protein
LGFDLKERKKMKLEKRMVEKGRGTKEKKKKKKRWR